MTWLIDLAMILVALGLLVSAGWQAWRKARRALAASRVLRDRAGALAAAAGELSSRLDTAEANIQYPTPRRG